VNSAPDVSVIIATRNRADVLRATLQALGRQSVDQARYEIVVIENGCSDHTSAVLTDLASTVPLVSLCLEHAGKSASLNKGMEHARGELLVFADDDLTIPKEFLSELLRASSIYRTAAGFCGPIIPVYPESTPWWLRRHGFRVPAFAEFSPPLPEGPLPNRFALFGCFTVRALAVRGLQYRTDLGASETNGSISCDDVDFARRSRDIAGPVWFVPSASVGHPIREEQISVAWLVERAFNLGRSLIAERIPAQSCHPPVWRLEQPSLWTLLDDSLMVNFLLGQWAQSARLGSASSHVEAHIRQLFLRISPACLKVALSASARSFLLADSNRPVRSLLEDIGETLSLESIYRADGSVNLRGTAGSALMAQ
jgi:glucosyl-dolichyl phosphate glucuronosyltransferase